MNEISCNEVELEGLAASEPALSHENHGKCFYRFPLLVPRLSGKKDLLPILIPEELKGAVFIGEALRLKGQLRSFNNKSGQGSRLVLSVYAATLTPGIGTAENRIRLSGTLCKTPSLRRTPLGRNICDLMLAVPRRYGRADYLPVIAWGQLAGLLAQRGVGDPVSLEGRIQSRPYTKLTGHGPEERTAYEVSLMHLLEEPVSE